jgi:hypothetical protein
MLNVASPKYDNVMCMMICAKSLKNAKRHNIIIKHLTDCNPPILFPCPKLGHIS